MTSGVLSLVKVSILLYAPTIFGGPSPDKLTENIGATNAIATASEAKDRLVHTGQVAGSVADYTGAVIRGAVVRLRKERDGRLTATNTDANGDFFFRDVAAGRYRLLISRAGFETRELKLTISRSGTSARLRIALAVGSVSTFVSVQGREEDNNSAAKSATEGTVGAGEIGRRPILRVGEILETVPGVIVTQHAGGGKANQYFLRGFNLDHGTDFAVFLDGMPLNLPSHAHGEGYADMNIVIPELVQRVNFEKGPYYADVGNYSSAGSAHLESFNVLPQDFAQFEGGAYGYGRLVFGASHRFGPGTLLLGGEAYHADGPWRRGDNYYKFNGLLTYSQGDETSGGSLTGRGYHGSWHSSDQIASNAVPLVGYFGTLNSTDGGTSQRYSIQGEWHRQGAQSISRLASYGFYYDLSLYSDFTYYLVDPIHGDQFNQRDRRWVAGVETRHTIFHHLIGRAAETTFGLQFRSDWIHNGLYQSQGRQRLDKVDYGTGNVLPAATQADNLVDAQTGLYTQTQVRWAERLRSTLALRGDLQQFSVTSLIDPVNSGLSHKVLPSPKATLVFGPWEKTEFYIQAGFSFHSNDGRGTTLHVEPVSGENPYPNKRTTPIPPLIPTKGGEIGLRTLASPHLQSTFSVWYLRSSSELQQSGDTGGTVPSQQPSERYGFESAIRYTPVGWTTFDLDVANSRALFTQRDADDAAPNSPGGRRVPEAVGLVVSSGATLQDLHGFTSSLRLRYFGSRELTSGALYHSKATALINADLGYRFSDHWSAAAEVLNLLNRRDHDIDYAYTSRTTPSSAPAFTDVFHPVEPIQMRFQVRRRF